METLEMPVEALNALPYSARALVVLDSEPAKSRWLEGLMGAPGKHYGLVSPNVCSPRPLCGTNQ